jgi:rhamnopyranosyl-N-acetylglucosaminyl-diphospho-decaprenol beta-1,3/1,4-galactofuranosyltransferase
MKILSIVVTYNRRDLLARCLDNLTAQSRQPDDLLVINNGSSDGTELMLQARGISFITQENLGAAAGWHCGIDYALSHAFDAVWLMDDDGYPDTKALEVLQPNLVEGVACVSSVVLREDRPTDFVFPFPVLNKPLSLVTFASSRKIPTLSELRAHAPEGVYPFAHLFNGALISLNAIKQIGNVDREYYIYGDEVDYFYRLLRFGKILSVLDAYHFHPDVSKRPFNPSKVYYYVRNSIVLNARYFKRPWFRFGLLMILLLYRMFLRNGPGFVLSMLGGGHSRLYYRAVVHGLQGRMGKVFYVANSQSKLYAQH